MIDRKSFFARVRAAIFRGRLNKGQVEGLTRILDEWERRGLADLRHLANMLAQSTWETSRTMQPVREGGGEKYLRSKRYYPWVGEGLMQVTWEANHRKFGATAPGQLMTWEKAIPALFDGMLKGMFTGAKLGDFFNATANDARNARRIVNPKDWKSYEPIRQMHEAYLAALLAAAIPDAPTEPATNGETDMPITPIAIGLEALIPLILQLIKGLGHPVAPNIQEAGPNIHPPAPPPPSIATEPPKSPVKSLTIWGAAVAALGSVLGGYQAFKAGDMAGAMAAVTAVMGAIGAIVGRFKATKPLG